MNEVRYEVFIVISKSKHFLLFLYVKMSFIGYIQIRQDIGIELVSPCHYHYSPYFISGVPEKVGAQ